VLLRAGRGQEATQEFQKVLAQRLANRALDDLAHLDLARAFALASNAAEARRHYQDFFALVKDADPDVPVMAQGRAEYAKLK
jgi:hypothetical protein